MIRFLIFLYLYSIIYTFATIKFSSYFLLIFFLFSSYIFLQKNLLLLLLHISKSVQFFCEIRTYFHGISVNFMVKYVKDAF